MIRAAVRALAIFDAFDNDHLSLSLQEVADRISMPKTTAFRLIDTLERTGFLIRLDNQRFCLSLKLARLGGLVRSTLNIRVIARSVMVTVNEQTSETIALNAIVGNDRMVLDVVDTPSPLMSMARPGERQPLLVSASARILMAYMSPERLEEVLAANVRSADFDRAALDRELARFRRQGYGLSRGQRVPGLTAVAVPIFDIDDEVNYCLSLTGPSVRVDSRDHELAEIMINAGREISSRLGASPDKGVDLRLLMSDPETSRGAPGRAERSSAKSGAMEGKPPGNGARAAKASAGPAGARAASPADTRAASPAGTGAAGTGAAGTGAAGTRAAGKRANPAGARAVKPSGIPAAELAPTKPAARAAGRARRTVLVDE